MLHAQEHEGGKGSGEEDWRPGREGGITVEWKESKRMISSGSGMTSSGILLSWES